MGNHCTASANPWLKQVLLDRLAISMAVVCGIHCLVTPVLLVALPIIGTTFWVDQNFHLWMLFLVLPTTSLALYSGCRRHKDRWVLGLGCLGLLILLMAFSYERVAYASVSEGAVPSVVLEASGAEVGPAHVAGGGCCALHPLDSEGRVIEGASLALAPYAVFNALGGFFLVLGHSRNFVLCRKSRCEH